MVQEYFSRDITVCADSDFNPHWEGEAGLNGDVEAGRQGRSGRRRGSNVALATEDSDESRSGASADGQTGPVLLRRPSDVASDRPAVAPALLLPSEDVPASSLTRIEKKASREAERSLLPDNHVVLPRRPRPPSEPPSGMITMLYKRLFSTRVPQPKGDEEAAASASTEDDEQLSETSPLLSGATAAGGSRMPPGGSRPRHEHLDEMWEAAFAAGQVETTWQREAKTLALYSRSLIFTFLLQYSINITSIFAVGRIGRLELGAVSCKSSSESYLPSVQAGKG